MYSAGSAQTTALPEPAGLPHGAEGVEGLFAGLGDTGVIFSRIRLRTLTHFGRKPDFCTRVFQSPP